ncbi:H/ACA ribonucleoprotein complex non-core subunit NAF1 isoform X2 [Anthonomus grandis grandis]|uniref:H/ACA ribonucleoprotein complex non-core subunit NAF1 isoform X2 n=1 Tax=Anthonomus grandis grandis TaxID=2921223 RepID=UPI0021653745|nr:H/ACA ribonucleoprotein complex non-core subunit NAF1 isoform X2 [Anthonomus grandis grandis]
MSSINSVDIDKTNKEIDVGGDQGQGAQDVQRDTDTKSPEMLMDEVREEVTKLNISGEEPQTVTQPPVTPSKVEVKQQSDSLRNLLVYDGDSDSDSESDSQDEGHKDTPEKKESNLSKHIKEPEWREEYSGSSDSETDSSASTLSSDSGSDSDSASVISDSDDRIKAADCSPLNASTKKGAVKKTNKSSERETDLPPIPDLSNLNISSVEEFMHIGGVTSVIGNIDYQSTKKPLGPIDDVIGPVSEPMYCVRFNNEDEIKKLDVKFGTKVYAAPKSEAFTKFVFLKELMKIKGSDASWLNDQEQPIELAEFSDDEMERQARKPTKTHSKRKLDDSSLERHQKYERTMNHCNNLNTRVCKLADAQKNLSKQIRTNHHRSDFQEPVPPAPFSLEPPTWIPPEFNPTVPPPMLGHPTPYGWPVAAPAATHPNTFSVGGQEKYAFAPMPLQNLSYFRRNLYANPCINQTVETPTAGTQLRGYGRARGQLQTFRQNSDNYFSNNSRNWDAGPSSQPF